MLSPAPRRPSILHLDLDAFFAAVEQRDKPSLRGKPVVVGGTGRRGVVATASYEARAFGIGSAMPTWEARRRCPNAAYLAGRFEAYRLASDQVMRLVRELSPLVEQLSLDEAYVDLSSEGADGAGQVEAAGPVGVAEVADVAEGLRARVFACTGLRVSVGAGTSKLVAKIASDLRKPDAMVVVPPGGEREFLAPLPVRRLPGVGAVTAERLHRHGVHLVGELAQTPRDDVVRLLGRAHGESLHAFSLGIDRRVVVAERDAKSVSAEETFATDITDRRLLVVHAQRLATRVSERLEAAGVSGRTVTVKVRRHDFATLNRSRTLPHATADAREIVAAGEDLLAAVDVADGVRLLGLGVSGLTEYSQLDLLHELQAGDAAQGATVSPAEQTDGPAEPDDDAPVLGPALTWRPGHDVRHAVHGPGWVQGAGVGRVTVRFEGPHTAVGRLGTFAVDDADLTPAEPPVW